MISFDKKQRFIVTGASSGIGEGIALLLNQLGATVIGIGRDSKRLEALRRKSQYPENMLVECKDLTDDIDELPLYVKNLKDKYGKFQGIVCCAGILFLEPVQVIDYNNMKHMFDINYYVPMFMAKGFADKRVNNGGGASVLFISSIASFYCEKGELSYSGSKAALSSSAKVLAKELSRQGIRVNVVSPADIETSMTKNVYGERFSERSSLYSFGMGDVSDVANLAVFLLSEKAKWINGQNYIVDCGSLL